MSDEVSFREALRADLLRMLPDEGHSRWRRRVELVAKFVLIPKIRAVAYYRLGHLLARRGLMPLALFLESRAIRGSGAEIHPLATIGPGLNLQHSVGVVIGPGVRVGRNLMIYHGVTLGDGATPGQPQIGDQVFLGTGASVLGGVKIGNGVIVGAHAVVTKDLPDNVIATGIPATHRPRTGLEPWTL